MDKKYTFTKEESKEKETKLTIKVAPAQFVTVKNKFYNKLSKSVVITGFRAGKAPRNLIEARISSEIYDETLNHILPETTYEIITNEKFTPLNQVKYEVVKMSDAEGVEFSAIFVNAPSIKLMDMKKVKVAKEEVAVTDKEVETELEKIVKMYTPKKDDKSGEKEEGEVKPEAKIEITDEVIKSLNLGFDSKAKVLEQIRKELEANRKYEQEQKYLSAILTEMVKGSKIEAPKALVNVELARSEKEYTERITQLGLKIEDFVKSQNTTLEALRKDWEKEAEKHVQEELLIYQVIKDNSLTITQEEIEKELNSIQDEKTRKQMETESGMRYLSTVIVQQKAINFIKDQVTKA